MTAGAGPAEGELHPMSQIAPPAIRFPVPKPVCRVLFAAGAAVALTGCVATGPMQHARLGAPGAYDPKYGVSASAKVIADGQPIPRGGGTYLVGRPYVVAGRRYYPSDRPFSAVRTPA